MQDMSSKNGEGVMRYIEETKGPRTVAQSFALVAGLVYVLIGVAGFFVTGFNEFVGNSEETLLIFEVNPFHNIVHIVIGGLWVATGLMLAPDAAQGVNFAIAGFYLLAAVAGFLGLGILDDLLSIDGALHPDNFLHLATALAALPFGVGVLRSQSARGGEA